jgi:iron-sulfur cluster assembly protein
VAGPELASLDADLVSEPQGGELVLTLTQGAAEAVSSIVSSSPGLPETAGLRISEQETAGGEASFHLALVEAPLEHDEVVEKGGARVFLEADAAQSLDDKVLDAAVDESGVKFGISPQV